MKEYTNLSTTHWASKQRTEYLIIVDIIEVVVVIRVMRPPAADREIQRRSHMLLTLAYDLN
ncbi:MAG: hypothetical protein BroJett013_02020 [Alphaproteobacteria bacterium]|nr:MAG: hypothetical protein BroJett013_02020 [Alphaproteobacteria bacterium]